MAISAAFTFFTAFLAFSLRCLLVWENRKLDKVYGSNKNRVVIEQGAEGRESEVGEENYSPKFRVRTLWRLSFRFDTEIDS